MKEISSDIKYFLEKEHFVIVSSHDKKGSIHTSAKGVVEVSEEGNIFILDLYKGWTYRNIKRNPHVTLTAINDRSFKGYSIQGRARIIEEEAISKKAMQMWHERLAKRIARRVIAHVKEDKSGGKHIPEARFPLPKYLIEVSVDRIVDLAPHRLK